MKVTFVIEESTLVVDTGLLSMIGTGVQPEGAEELGRAVAAIHDEWRRRGVPTQPASPFRPLLNAMAAAVLPEVPFASTTADGEYTWSQCADIADPRWWFAKGSAAVVQQKRERYNDYYRLLSMVMPLVFFLQ
jgi:hypothetical protein